jgi:hypothetical protein
MNIENGDRFTTQTPLSENHDYEKKLEAARRGIKKYQNALIELAKRSFLFAKLNMKF